MVAYSFAPQFVAPIEARTKLQTVRGHRRRHARVGEPIQLYTAMRTKQCRKLVEPDPVVTRVWPITIFVNKAFHSGNIISRIDLDFYHLPADEMEAFARADGFVSDDEASALRRMGEFWVKAHDVQGDFFRFDGVVIRWGWPS
jgi:hypothetical protein